jgi:hypothetical protein
VRKVQKGKQIYKLPLIFSFWEGISSWGGKGCMTTFQKACQFSKHPKIFAVEAAIFVALFEIGSFGMQHFSSSPETQNLP